MSPTRYTRVIVVWLMVTIHAAISIVVTIHAAISIVAMTQLLPLLQVQSTHPTTTGLPNSAVHVDDSLIDDDLRSQPILEVNLDEHGSIVLDSNSFRPFDCPIDCLKKCRVSGGEDKSPPASCIRRCEATRQTVCYHPEHESTNVQPINQLSQLFN